MNAPRFWALSPLNRAHCVVVEDAHRISLCGRWTTDPASPVPLRAAPEDAWRCPQCVMLARNHGVPSPLEASNTETSIAQRRAVMADVERIYKASPELFPITVAERLGLTERQVRHARNKLRREGRLP